MRILHLAGMIQENKIPPPDSHEYHQYYQGYVDLGTGQHGPERVLTTHVGRLRQLEGADGSYAYAPGKWTIKQLMQHLIDVERTFTYRLMAIMHEDRTPLPTFDQDAYAKSIPADHRSLTDLIDEFSAVRAATICLVQSIPPDRYAIIGNASGADVSVRALVYITAGHTEHHINVLNERYGTVI